MDKFKIFETDQYIEDLKKNFKGRQTKIRNKLLDYVYPQLRNNPYYGNNIKKLRNYSPDTWRYRIGDYRFFYEIDKIDKLVLMTVAESRQSAY